MRPFTIAVVGGNAAGAAAAAKAKRVNPAARVVLFEKTEFISVGVCEFPFVLSGEISDPSSLLFFSAQKFALEKDVEVFIQSEVTSVDVKERIVKFTSAGEPDEKNLYYDRLILATGSKQKELPGLDGNLENVLCLKNYPDLLRTKKFLDELRPNNAIVIGSGYLGLEIAEALTVRGIEVTMLEKEESILPHSEPEFSAILTAMLREKKIETQIGVQKLTFNQKGNRVTSIKADARLYDAEAVLPAIGFRPDTRMIAGLNFKRGDYGELITDGFMRTSLPYIYTAGDSAGVKNFITSKHQVFYSAKVAHTTGHIAGSNAAGRNEQFPGAIPIVSFRMFDRYFSQTGLTEQTAREQGFVTKTAFSSMNNLVHVMPDSIITAAKLVVNRLNNQILGATFFGGKEVSGFSDLITLMMRNRITYSSLLESDFNYTPALSPFRNILISLIHKINKG